MAGTATRTVRIRFLGDSAGLGKAADESERHVSRFGSALARVGKAAAIGAAAVAGGFAAIAKSSVDAFVESETAQAKLADAYARFPKLANVGIESLREFNSQLAKKVKFDDDAIASGQAVLGQFNLTGTQLRTLTPLLVDFAAKTGRDLPTAATTLGKAFMGNTKALKDLGINYKATGDQAKDTAAITELLRKSVGGFAEKEGQTAAGRAEILKNQFGEIQEQVGAKLLPVLMAMGNWILEVGIPAIERFVEWFQVHLGPVIAQVFNWIKANVFPIIGQFVTWIRTSLIPAIMATVQWFRDNWHWISVLAIALAAAVVPILAVVAAQKAWAVATTAVEAAQLLLNKAMLANPILIIVALIAGLVAAFITLWERSAAFRDFFIGVWDSIKSVVGSVVDFVKNLWSGLVNWFGNLPDEIGRKLGRLGDIIGGAFKAGINAGISAVNAGVRFINTLIDGINFVSGAVGIPAIPHIPEIPKLARGGFIARGGLAMVGERGREIVSLPAGAQVHSNRDTEAMMGGVPEVHVYIGDRELRDVVRVEMVDASRQTRRRALSGAGGAP